MTIHPVPPRSIAVLFFICVAFLLKGQDIHYTLYTQTPVAFNPANTGAFYGSYRIAGIYRDQYRAVAGTGAFRTPSFSVDAPIIRGFRKQDWVGVGLYFYTDQSGEAGLSQTTYKISGAYHLALGKKHNSVITLGYQTGGISRRIKNAAKLRFEDPQDVGNIFNEGDKKGKAYTDHVVGLRFSSKYNKTDEYNFGFAMSKFGKPEWSLIQPKQGDSTSQASGSYRVNGKLYAYAGLSTVLSNRVRFSPNISLQDILKTKENTLVIQGIFDYLLDPEKNVVLIGGLGYRTGANIGDALQIMAGAYIKDIRVMLGYDLNISSLSEASYSQGGFELSALYIGKIYKRPKPDPVILCPRF